MERYFISGMSDVLADGSGVAIYNSFDGNTLFLQSHMQNADYARLLSAKGFLLTEFAEQMGIGEAECQAEVKRLLKAKVLIKSA